jgi:hypothetical protein
MSDLSSDYAKRLTEWLRTLQEEQKVEQIVLETGSSGAPA